MAARPRPTLASFLLFRAGLWLKPRPSQETAPVGQGFLFHARDISQRPKPLCSRPAATTISICHRAPSRRGTHRGATPHTSEFVRVRRSSRSRRHRSPFDRHRSIIGGAAPRRFRFSPLFVVRTHARAIHQTPMNSFRTKFNLFLICF